ncbi:D-amino-acid oxidase [Mycena crocata]|nr:D-amino-acid oxidase [Mycena crocata]
MSKRRTCLNGSLLTADAPKLTALFRTIRHTLLDFCLIKAEKTPTLRSKQLPHYFMAKKALDVFVVGAGVVGLSTAIRALEAGFNVTIFAEIFPQDKKSIKYSSCWAGADHISDASTTELLHELEKETLSTFFELIKEDPLVPVMVRPHKEYAQVFGPYEQENYNHLSQIYSDFRTLQSSELPERVVHGAIFSTICIDVPRYLVYLIHRFIALGGQSFRVTLPSLSTLLSEKDCPTLEALPTNSANTMPSFEPSALINCSGIGALAMGDVLDTNIHPTRGEVVILRAPWIHEGLSYSYQDGHRSYIIPRQSGDVIIGGTWQVDDWYPDSRPKTVKLIKERAIEAYPELLPANKRKRGSIDDLDVLEECVGLRPTRNGGLRQEVSSLSVCGKNFPIVHNYGHGGAGYQSSWGSARLAVDLLKSAISG